MSTITADKRASVRSSVSSVSGNGRKQIIRKSLNFNTYIHKLVKGGFISGITNMSMTRMVIMQLDLFAKILSNRIAGMALQIAYGSGRQTIVIDDIMSCCNILLPKSLCEMAVEKGNIAVQQYSTSPSGRQPKANRSGLNFPPHISEKFLRLQNSASQVAASSLSVSQTAPVFMAGVIESIETFVLQLASKVTIEDKRKTITVRDLLLGTMNNEETMSVLKVLNISWLGGGVNPSIHPSLLPTKEKQTQLALKRRKARKEAGNGPGIANRKALPGTKALRNIRKYQRTTGLLQRKEHFKRFVKEYMTFIWGEEQVHFNAGVIEYLQLFIEEQISNVFSKAVLAMVHSGRETVEERDIQLVWNLIRPQTFHECEFLGLENMAEPGIQRLSLRGGVKRLSQNSFDITRRIMAEYLYNLLNVSSVLMKRQKIRTMSIQFLRRGASLLGFNIPIDFTKVTKSKRSQTAGDEMSMPDETGEVTEVDEVDEVDDEVDDEVTVVDEDDEVTVVDEDDEVTVVDEEDEGDEEVMEVVDE